MQRKTKETTYICKDTMKRDLVNMSRDYGVATISRLLKIIGLFCRISSLLYSSFAKETYNFKEPTNCSHPISKYAKRLRKFAQRLCSYLYMRTLLKYVKSLRVEPKSTCKETEQVSRKTKVIIRRETKYICKTHKGEYIV